MSNRVRISFLVALLITLLATAGILANDMRGDADVTANGNNTFTPEAVTIFVDQSVNWTNASGFHNVVADDNSFTSGVPSSDPWNFSQQFSAPGSYAYYCSVHGSAGGGGMSGVVNVVAPAAYLPVTMRP